MCAASWYDLDLTSDLAYLMLFYLSTGISDTILSLLYLSYILLLESWLLQLWVSFGSNSNWTFIALNLLVQKDSGATKP